MLPDQTEWSSTETEAVLFYSYLPNHGTVTLPEPIREAATEESITANESELIRRGRNCVKRTFSKLLEEHSSNANHVVPLSGGLDSRLILAALLKYSDIPKNNITTVTFGTPGTWDFEIGQQIANESGVENISIDLTAGKISWTVEDLVKTAKCTGAPAPILQAHINRIPTERYSDPSSVFWSGYMGDTSVGSHQPSSPCKNWECALDHFVENNRKDDHVHSIDLDPKTILPSTPFMSRTSLSYEEQLDFGLRQQKYIRPVVMPLEDQYETPFMRKDWLSFWLNIPPSEREGRHIFKKVVKKEFPHLFSLPTSSNYGLPMMSSASIGKVKMELSVSGRKARAHLSDYTYVHPGMNYISFGDLFRNSDELKMSARNLLQKVAQRDGVQMDVEALWQEHQSGNDHTQLLQSLLSIEAYLESIGK